MWLAVRLCFAFLVDFFVFAFLVTKECTAIKQNTANKDCSQVGFPRRFELFLCMSQSELKVIVLVTFFYSCLVSILRCLRSIRFIIIGVIALVLTQTSVRTDDRDSFWRHRGIPVCARGILLSVIEIHWGFSRSLEKKLGIVYWNLITLKVPCLTK